MRLLVSWLRDFVDISAFAAKYKQIWTQFTLYVESPAARADGPAALSGRYVLGNSSARGGGIIGELRGPDVTLAILGGELVGDTADVFVGELAGDTLRGSYQKSGLAAVFLRTP